MVSLAKSHNWPSNENLCPTISRSQLLPSMTAQDLSPQKTVVETLETTSVKIQCYWAEELHTQFFVAVESEDGLQQVRLPGVDRVEIRQEFAAQANDELAFSYLTAIHTTCYGKGWQTQITASLTNLDTGESTNFLSRSMDPIKKSGQRPAREIESVKHLISQPGHYLLRFAQQLKDAAKGARVQLWVQDARVSRGAGSPVETPLPSISCLSVTK